MSGNRFLRSPLLVLAAGVGTTAVALALIVSGGGPTLEDVTTASTVGLLCAAVTAGTSAWQRHQLDHDRRSLTQAEHDAKHDPLTGLANRSELYRELEVSLRQATIENTIFGVLFLDLDRFKLINDSMGHDVGDELLRIVAERLKAATRSSDVVARLGGDEFVLICRGLLSNDSVLAVVRQVLRSFTEPVKLKGHQQIISTSVGVAISTVDETRTPDEMVRDADAAMYKAKRDGSGFAVFDETERSLLSNRLAVERDLGQAFDREQLVVHYQPIIDVEQQRLYGFEALIRWDHPERGLVSPAYFLPVAESARLMARLGELVLREACAQAALWTHLHPGASDLHISVNVAAQQLIDTTFPVLVDDVLRWSGLRPEQLVLEIAEDVMVEHLEGATNLRQLRDLGVSLAVDDFGTGRSSLSYIKHFGMAAALKIDQSFVRRMQSGKADQAIIAAIVTMASALGLAVVAEGVEEEAEVERLLDIGVGLMQGYLFNQPASADSIGDLTAMLDFSASDPAARFRSVAINRPLVHSVEIEPISEL